jgi:protein TonB
MIRCAILWYAFVTFSVPAEAVSVMEWHSAVARAVAKHQTYPRSAQIRHEQGITRLVVTIDANGKISEVQLADSSGSTILDYAARLSITKMAKLPSPPPGLSKVTIPIVWRLD